MTRRHTPPPHAATDTRRARGGLRFEIDSGQEVEVACPGESARGASQGQGVCILW